MEKFQNLSSLTLLLNCNDLICIMERYNFDPAVTTRLSLRTIHFLTSDYDDEVIHHDIVLFYNNVLTQFKLCTL